MSKRKAVPLRLDPAIYEAVARWADDDLRSVNAQIEIILREGLRQAGRLPKNAGGLPRRGRPPKKAPQPEAEAQTGAEAGTRTGTEAAGDSKA